MHPIERLRHVARAGTVDHGVLVREAASALASLGFDPPGLVTACRRLLERHPAAGPLWALSARMLTAGESVAEGWRFADEVDADPTPRHFADELPEEGRVVVLGWPEQIAAGLPRRGDVEVLVVDSLGEGVGLARRLRAADVDAADIPESGMGAAIAGAEVLALEAAAVGPDGAVALAGSRAAAAVARHAGVPVWLVAGTGRVLPDRLWRCVVERLDDDEPWESELEVVPLDLVDRVVGPTGLDVAASLGSRSDCPVAPELLKIP